MNDNRIDINKIIRESIETLQNPKDYFTNLTLSGNFAEPVIKAAFYGTVAGVFALLWSVLGLSRNECPDFRRSRGNHGADRVHQLHQLSE